MLDRAELVAFIPVADIATARSFYESALGLPVVEDSPFALVVNANGTRVRITPYPAFARSPSRSLAGQSPTSTPKLRHSGRAVSPSSTTTAWTSEPTASGRHPAVTWSHGSLILTATRCH